MITIANKSNLFHYCCTKNLEHLHTNAFSLKYKATAGILACKLFSPYCEKACLLSVVTVESFAKYVQ